MTADLGLLDAPPPAPVHPLHAPTDPALLAWLINDVLLGCYRPLISALNVWQWADAGNVFLDGKASPTPGYYASAKTPWTRRLQEMPTDPQFAMRPREYHGMKSSRTGFTEAELNVIRWMPEHRPGPALYAIDTTEEAKKVVENRLVPTLPASARTGDVDDITKKLIRLRNMNIEVGGSYSPSLFLNKFLLFIGLDEVEAVKLGEGDETMQGQARTRMVGVPGAYLCSISKPRLRNSPHHVEVVTGTLNAFLVPCPHCGTFQELSFSGPSPTHELRIDEPLKAGERPPSPALAEGAAPRCGRVRFDHCVDLLGHWEFSRLKKETYYECVSGCHIFEHETIGPDILGTPRADFFSTEVRVILATGRTMRVKAAMCLSGHDLATNPAPHRDKVSSHISDLYALHDDLTWGDLAEKFIKAKPDPTELMTFINNHLGLPWAQRRSAAVGDKHLLQCREPYARGTTPFVPDIVLIGIDSQFDHWKFVVAAYRLSRERAVVNWGRAGTGPELLDEFNRPIPLYNGKPDEVFHINRGFVDAAGAEGTTDKVYSLCRHSWSQAGGHLRLFPAFGRDYTTNTKVIWESEILHEFKPLRIYFFGDEIFKRRLYLGSILQVAEIKAAIATGHTPEAKGLPPRLRLPAQPGDAALRELMDELQSERVNLKGKWEKTRGAPNDYGDGLKLCDVMFDHVRPLLLAEHAAKAAAAAKALTPPKQ